MKKIFKITSVIAVILVVIAACQNDSDKKSNSVNKETAASFEQLLTNVGEYNTSFMQEHEVDAVTKGRWSLWGWIVSADAFGALIGSVGGPVGAGLVGIIGSLGAALYPPEDIVTVNDNCFSKADFEIYIGIVDGDEYDEMGYIHNEIICALYDKYGEDFIANASERTIFEITLAELKNNGYDVSFIEDNIEECYLKVKNVNGLIKQAGDAAALISLAKAAYPELAQELSVVESYVAVYELLPQESDTRIGYTSGFREIIEASGIPEDSKVVIRSGISTALGSGSLWVVEE